MSAPEANVITPPPAPPAPAPVTVEHISALHAHIDRVWSYLSEKLHELAHLVERAAPLAEAAAAAVAPVLGDVAAPVVAAVEKVAELVCCCQHAVPHTANGCTVLGCTCAGTAK